jgi:hypothetical protein
MPDNGFEPFDAEGACLVAKAGRGVGVAEVVLVGIKGAVVVAARTVVVVVVAAVDVDVAAVSIFFVTVDGVLTGEVPGAGSAATFR